ncbi:MAG: beta-phosphoglucomutase [Cyclobacteriaceae bacterium]|nr:beta-phosphoglucomutase [Cyclobacteriaceae bacterium]
MKAVIFDLDGVLVDTAKYHYLAWKKLAAELGVNLTEKENERLKGVSRMDSLKIILSLGGLTFSEAEMNRLADRKNSWFVEYIDQMKPEEIFDGVFPLLNALREAGVSIALASSSKNAAAVLKNLLLENTFDTVVDGTMIKESKPDPEIFLKAADNLGVAPNECIVVEDAEAGVEAARRAGMKAVGIGHTEQLGEAELVVDHISKLSYNRLKSL